MNGTVYEKKRLGNSGDTMTCVMQSRRYLKLPILAAVALLLSGCAGLNPNPGERTADLAWDHGDYARSVSVIRQPAERGEPWAQLRLGVAYELGSGVSKDTQQAAHWYRRAAAQEARGAWAHGQIIGAIGRMGYFNQTSDALIAQYQLAGLYLRGDGAPRDVRTAYFLARNVAQQSKGYDIFYCWEGTKGLYITAEMIAQRRREIEQTMTPEELRVAESDFAGWTVQQIF